MRNIVGFLVAVAIVALGLVGYGHYNAKAKTEQASEAVSVAKSEPKPYVVDEPKPAPASKPKAEAKPQVESPKPAEKPAEKPVAKAEVKPEVKPTPKPEPKPTPKPTPKSNEVDFDKKMKEYGLVDIRTLDKNILVDLKYSTTDNFVGKDMYGSLVRAYLEPSFAQRVLKAQKLLRKRFPKYTLLVYDAARPISVQRTMKQIVAGTEFDSFVASGTKGGRHNYGVAVDVTIADGNGKALDMGTGFDSFDAASSVKGTSDNSDPTTRTIAVYRAYVRGLQSKGLISKQAADNRILLLEVMHEAGLYPYRREWWHFELIDSMAKVRETYRLLDF